MVEDKVFYSNDSDSKMSNREFYQTLTSMFGLRLFKDFQLVVSTSSLPTI